LKSGKWQITFYPHGRKKRESYPTKTHATLALQKRKVEIAEGKYLDKKKQEKIRFSDFAQTYLDTHSKVKKRSWKRDKDIIELHLSPVFGHKNLYEITRFDVEGYIRERMPSVKPATVNRELACLKTIFSKAVEWGKATDNPAKKVKLLRVNNTRTKYLEKKEISRLLENCSEPLYSIVTIALNTGMRKSEILNLKRSDIDLDRRLIYLLETKSGDKREVPINKIVFNTLLKVKKNPHSPYVFYGNAGKPFQDIKKSYHKALEKAGIKDFTFHDLRHTFASHLVMMGTDLKTVQELLGHKTFQMTLRYAHLSPSHKKAAVDNFANRMDSFWTLGVKYRKVKNVETIDTVRATSRI